MSSLEYLKTQIKKQIESANKDRIKYKKHAYASYILGTIFNVSITVITGLNNNSSFQIGNFNIDMMVITKFIVIFLSGTITVVNSIDFFFQNKALWINNNKAKNDFRKLLTYIEYRECEPNNIKQEDIENWYNEFQKIIDRRNENWDEQRSKSDQNKK